MAFAQRSYLQIQGTNGKYRIDQIGCFLTAFSNLTERYGRAISPVDLNREFVNRGIYIDVDDGVRDDLAWGSISGYDGHIQVDRTGTGVPPSTDAIVKFHYKGASGFNTHFCLVADRSAGLIIDSWDGQLKSWNTYGGPVAWATYTNKKPAAIAPIQPPAPAPIAVDPNILLIKVLPGWGISHVAKAAGYPNFADGAAWNTIARANGQADASTFRLTAGQTVRVPKYITPVPTPTPAPVAAPISPAPAPRLPKIEYEEHAHPKELRVKTEQQVEAWDFSTALSLSEIKSLGVMTPGSQFLSVGTATTESGYRFEMNSEDFEARNGQGVYEKDLDPAPAASPELEAPNNNSPIPTPTNPDAWQETLTKNFAGEYDAEEDYVILDLSDPSKPGIRLNKGQLVTIFATFIGPDGGSYYSPITKTYGKDHFYGIPHTVLGADPIEVDDPTDFDVSTELDEIRQRKPKNSREQIAALLAIVWSAVLGILARKPKGTK